MNTAVGVWWRTAVSLAGASCSGTVLYLGEINSSQELAWRRSIEVFEDGESAPRTYALFPEDRCEGLLPNESIVRLKTARRIEDGIVRAVRGTIRIAMFQK